MRYAEFLKKDGVIGFVAPSFGCATEPYRSAFDSAKKEFARRGYILVTGPNCYESSGIGISSTPQKCGEELTYMYINSSSDILISCGGGELILLFYRQYLMIQHLFMVCVQVHLA